VVTFLCELWTFLTCLFLTLALAGADELEYDE
jgi:hypothetical protein